MGCFFDSDETEETVSPEDILDRLLSTIFAGYAAKKQQVEIKKRKDVFDLVFTKNNRILSLAMVYEYDRFVNSDPNFKPALFIHDTEEFDVWQFPLDATDEDIFRVVYPAVKSPKSRK
ncbi:hypothetical protein LJ707_02350 [Mucilaginibacter sp. UR6-1]|uniref:hypothetical protein n=1 Tax=Mucilaginibacter sp. UR6-1 TaxID=1435643 RepID=UPI001E3364BF|nr:hypothetical protein [Mucilaginibacter sp. UR6-1]MCC8407753.1 hypothetical protein [Mucilaginibacter sp. UR6-1]